MLYLEGAGVPTDIVESEKWVRLSAAQNFASAQYTLGGFFAGGRGKNLDYVEAAQWYTKAAEAGYAQAQYQLALLYTVGWGVPVDAQAATKWRELAILQGNIGAIHLNNGRLDSEPIKPSAVEKFLLAQAAAERGDRQSQLELANERSSGKHIPKDLTEACKWQLVHLGANAPVSDAALKEHFPGLSDEHIVEGRKRAAAFQQLFPDRKTNSGVSIPAPLPR